MLVACFLFLGLPLATCAADWPQWRYDAGRGAASPESLSAELHLRWMRELPPPRPAWPESQADLRFDVSYSPVVAGKRLFVPSMVTDSLTAYDTDTGRPLWRFYADGPVRLAPVAAQDRVYFASDDGYLYCLDAAHGHLQWRVRGGPSDRRILGNERLISTWPIRGGPVLFDGTLYFTAGIWPFMGIFVHAVDAQTGNLLWTNSGEGAAWSMQPHNSPAFSGFVPRGHLAATPHGLVAPGGRTEPGCYDLKTGQFYSFSFGPKLAGTCHVSAHGPWFFVEGTVRQIADGKSLMSAVATVHDAEAIYEVSDKAITAQALKIEEQQVERTGRKGEKLTTTARRLKPLWQRPLPEPVGQLFLKAGSRFYCGSEGQVVAIEAGPGDGPARIVWRGTFEGQPWTMLAADEKLFVVTTAGRIYCYSSTGSMDERSPNTERHEARADEHLPIAAKKLLDATGIREGYAVLFGLGSGALAESLARSRLTHVIVIEPDAAKVDAFRRRMDEAGLYGTRIAALVGEGSTYPLPPYLANLVVVQDQDVDEPLVQAAFRVLRPYGGTAHLPVAMERLKAITGKLKLPGAEIKSAGQRETLLVRSGPLPGAADWTHQYADAANSVVSRDQRVKLPLGLLWFGGPSNDEVLPRHGHGPSPQVAAGRLLIEGRHMLRALDIYTGRLLWQKDLPDLGLFYDNTLHQPGANEIGSNYVTLADAVYVAYRDTILQLNPATGETVREIKSPAKGLRWGFLSTWENLLIATCAPVEAQQDRISLSKLLRTSATKKEDAKSDSPASGEGREKEESPTPPRLEESIVTAPYAAASQRLVVFDRHSGRLLWERSAQYSFRHNTIAAGADRLFCIDSLSKSALAWLKRRGAELNDYRPQLMALDARTGEELWSTTENVFGTFLNYSTEHDILLQAGSFARDRARDEAETGMVAYQGKTGQVLWKDLRRVHSGPCMLHHDTIITQGKAYSLLTGEQRLRQDPLTGESIPWQFTRNYGCNTVIGAEHLLTFRSAAAGFYDLDRDGGTGNLGGFKSSCTSNLIAAGGLLNAPEYTRTCTCNYQNQTSLAMIHDPNAEMWTFNALRWDGKPVRRVGINFGAPGDRRSDEGTLWLDHPSCGSPSPQVPVEVEPATVRYFRHHSSQIHVPSGTPGLSWVAASGVAGVRRVTLTLASEPVPPRRYTVRLHFAEPDDLRPGQRVFRVRLQDQEALARLDLRQATGATRTTLVKEFHRVEASDKLVIAFDPVDDASAEPVLCGLEIVEEGGEGTATGTFGHTP